MSTYSSTLAWKISWMEETDWLQSMGSEWVRHDWWTSFHFTSGGSEGRIGLQCGRHGFDPWVGKIPWRREWQPIPVFLPGEFHGQTSLAGYSLQVTELDMTERLTLNYLLYWGRVPFCKGTETNLQSFANCLFLKLHCPSDNGSLGLGSGPGIRIF